MTSPSVQVFTNGIVRLTYVIQNFSSLTKGAKIMHPLDKCVKGHYYLGGFRFDLLIEKTDVTFGFYTPLKTTFSIKYYFDYIGNVVHSGTVTTIKSKNYYSFVKAFPNPNKRNQNTYYDGRNQAVSDTLTVTLDCSKATETDLEIYQFQLPNDLKQLIGNEETSDLVINVNGKAIFAHKCILSARSPVFKAMFTSNLKESTSNVLDIKDFDEDTVAEMLEYIYTGISPNLARMAHLLVGPAEKYLLEPLKELCETQLLENLSPEKGWEYLLLSDQYGLEELKDACLCNISVNLRDALKSTDLEDILPSRPHLIREILSTIADVYNPS